MARITVINDSSEFLDVMDDLISAIGHQMTGFNAVAVSIEEVVASQPLLIVLDLRLENQAQEISGWELLALARAHQALQSVPIILCTAATWELEKRADDLARIAQVHIRTKPFAVEDMVALITDLLPKAATGSRA
jgi:CheY-like chemotaxis protein